MRKKYYNCIGFIMLGFCSIHVNAAEHKSNGSKKIGVNINKKVGIDINAGKTKKEIFLSENREVIKDVEVNSVNFIKLQKKANEVFIPDPNIIDVQILSDNSLYLIGLAPGVTSLVINDVDGNVIVNCKVKVTYPLKSIKSAIFELLPESDVEILSIDDSVILKGRVPSPEAASEVQEIVSKFIDSAKIVNKLNIETATQVMLKVKIAEVSRELTNSLGINWRAVSSSDSMAGTAFGFVTGNSTSFMQNQSDTAGFRDELLKNGGVMGVEKGGRWVMQSVGRRGLSGLIDALASESFASILAEPTLIALSGKKATFKSGGEQGYTVTQPGGSDSNTTEFKEWGTSIEFTPIVLSEDRINITVTPKISTLSFTTANGPPSLTTKEASTTVELGSGQSMAIAGLLQKTKDYSASETPFLAKIPLIGALFRSNGVISHEKEIVIIVTPYIVKPASKPLKTPLDMVPKMYSPIESLFKRKFHKTDSDTKNVAAGFSII
jgi:pilus assembly protein CpaC